MAKVKVWNDNVHPHTETFKGEKISIPAGEYIEMEWEEAIEFKGQFTGVAPLGQNGAPDPKFFKMIRVERADPNEVFKTDQLVNHATGKTAASPAELAAMLAEFKHLLVKDDDAEKALRASTPSEVDALKAELAALRALVEGNSVAKKGGRPKKEAVA